MGPGTLRHAAVDPKAVGLVSPPSWPTHLPWRAESFAEQGRKEVTAPGQARSEPLRVKQLRGATLHLPIALPGAPDGLLLQGAMP